MSQTSQLICSTISFPKYVTSLDRRKFKKVHSGIRDYHLDFPWAVPATLKRVNNTKVVTFNFNVFDAKIDCCF